MLDRRLHGLLTLEAAISEKQYLVSQHMGVGERWVCCSGVVRRTDRPLPITLEDDGTEALDVVPEGRPRSRHEFRDGQVRRFFDVLGWDL